MRKLAAALCVAVCASLTLVPATEAAAAKRKPPYGVTVTAPGTAVVGTAVTVSGKVSGKGAGRSKVAVQVRYGSAAWRTVATPRTTRSGAYSVKVSLAHAGNVQLRTVKSASKFRRAGASRAVTLLASRWIDLTQAPSATYSAGLNRHSVLMGGKRYTTSFQSWLGGMYLQVRPDGKCSTFEFTTGFADADLAAVDPDTRVSGAVGSAQTPSDPVALLHEFEVGSGAPAKQTVDVTGKNLVLMEIGINDSAGDEPRTVIAEPRMLCTTDGLPEIGDGLIML